MWHESIPLQGADRYIYYLEDLMFFQRVLAYPNFSAVSTLTIHAWIFKVATRITLR